MELRRILETTSLEQGKCLRLAMPPAWVGEGDFGIVIDAEAEEDQVVELEGVKLLLVSGGLAEGLAKAILDFKESPDGPRFTLDVF